MIAALFDIVNAAAKSRIVLCCFATQTQHRQGENHLQIQHDKTRHRRPCTAWRVPMLDRAALCPEFVPSFYEAQNPLRPHEQTKTFIVRGLICLFASEIGRCRKS
jgi:hypothetical protein